MLFECTISERKIKLCKDNKISLNRKDLLLFFVWKDKIEKEKEVKTMKQKEYQEFIKRYHKFKKNNLPTPFFDKERQTFEYVYYNQNRHVEDYSFLMEDKNLCIFDNLTEAFQNIASVGFYYPFTCRCYLYTKEKGKLIAKKEIRHTHTHSFEDVVRYLYDSPNSFSISESEEDFYSKQQLQYLKFVQKYLLFIGMKDLENKTVQRYRNKREKKYIHQYIYRYPKETLEDFITGKRNFTVRKYSAMTVNYIKYKPKEYRVLMTDTESNFRLYVEFTYREIKEYRDIKAIYHNKQLQDEEKVEVTYFKILEVLGEKE